MEESSIYKKEESLHDELRKTYSLEEREKIVDDGLCWASISNEIPVKENKFWPENLWTESKRRILFLLKEPNGNGGEDYKDWDWGAGNGNFGNVLSYWLEGLKNTTSDYKPDYNDTSSREKICKKYPFAIVNVKKVAGDSSADWNELWDSAKRNQKFLKKQIREILNPNIIVCGGSNDSGNDYKKMLSIALDFIFDDEKENFKKINKNNWCYYNSKLDILLIDSYHPSYIMNERDKINSLITAFQEFINEVDYKN